MQKFQAIAASAALLSAGAMTAAYADSSSEMFSPDPSSVVYFDGGNKTMGTFGGIGYEVIKGHAVAEGDMVLGMVDPSGRIIGSQKRGLGQSRVLDRWPNGIIPFQFSPETSDEERRLAEEAIAHWNQYTAISLVELNDENRADFENYITFESSNGCASYVGMRGGDQQLWISASCGVGSIIHELGHAVGLFHEHTRNDRDNFISVNWDNIVPGKEFNFDVLSANAELLGDYDYGSIMHYGENFFSSNGQATIEVHGDAEIGQRIALSDHDIASANMMYETDLSLSVDARDNSEQGTIDIDIQVTNQGSMGANQLTLNFELTNGATWLSMSPDSGWDCSVNGTFLNCDRMSLEASATSLFTILASANGATTNDLTGQVTAKSQETDYSNNGFQRMVSAPAAKSATNPVDASSEPEKTGDTQDKLEATPESVPQDQPDAETNMTAGTENQNSQEPGAPGSAMPVDENNNDKQSSTGDETDTLRNTVMTNKAETGGGAFSPLMLLGFALIRVRRRKV